MQLASFAAELGGPIVMMGDFGGLRPSGLVGGGPMSDGDSASSCAAWRVLLDVGFRSVTPLGGGCANESSMVAQTVWSESSGATTGHQQDYIWYRGIELMVCGEAAVGASAEGWCVGESKPSQVCADAGDDGWSSVRDASLCAHGCVHELLGVEGVITGLYSPSGAQCSSHRSLLASFDLHSVAPEAWV
eukprot:SAG11_NODE_170_length_13624_cov_40.078226_6_plen_189_part_00